MTTNELKVIGIRKELKPIKDAMDQLKTAYIKKVLALTDNNKSLTAEVLSISRPTLDKLLDMHGISKK